MISHEQFVEELEEIFRERYTDADEEYVKCCNKHASPPPVVDWRAASENKE